MKSPIRFSVVLAGGLVLALGGSLGAQSNGTWRISPESNSRRGIETPPKQSQVVVVPSLEFGGAVFPRQPIAFVMIPAILMSDGTVLANFGMGYEPVTRSCGGTVVVTTPQVVASNGRVLNQRPTYMQPAPNQATASQQNLPSAQRSFPILTAASQTACFSSDPSGRFFVVRQ